MNNQNPYSNLIKIILKGDYGTGRTSLLVRYVEDVFNNFYTPTIGVDFRIRTIDINGQGVKLQIWDIQGAQRFVSMSRIYYRRANAVLIAADITSNRLEIFQRNIQQILQNKQQEAIVVVVGTKIDLRGQKQYQDHTQQIKKIAEKYKLQYYETSSKENIGVQDLFNEVGKKCLQNIKDSNKRNFGPNLQSIQHNKNKNGPKIYSTCW